MKRRKPYHTEDTAHRDIRGAPLGALSVINLGQVSVPLSWDTRLDLCESLGLGNIHLDYTKDLREDDDNYNYFDYRLVCDVFEILI